MIPRELNPEFYWRIRLWIAGWKSIVLVVTGALFGAGVVLSQLVWPGGAQGLFFAGGLVMLFFVLVSVLFR